MYLYNNKNKKTYIEVSTNNYIIYILDVLICTYAGSAYYVFRISSSIKLYQFHGSCARSATPLARTFKVFQQVSS